MTDHDEKKEGKTSGIMVSSAVTLEVRNPLVAMFAIEDYTKCDQMKNMHTAKSDYFRVFEAMHITHGYSFVCMVDKNEENETKNSNEKDKEKENENKKNINSFDLNYNQNRPVDGKLSKKKWKTHITCDDINRFNNQIKQTILTNKNKNELNYDGLIYFISCLGDKDNVIYDSNGEDGILDFLFEEFTNKECKCLTNKPKIFIIDTSRGASISKGIENPKLNLKLNLEKTVQKLEKLNDCTHNNSSDKPVVDDNEQKEKEKRKEKRKYSKLIHASQYAQGQKQYLEYDDFRVIYATPDGFKKIEHEYQKTSILIKNFCKLCKKENDLTRLIYQTKSKVEKDVKKLSKKDDKHRQCQVVVDNNRLSYNVVLIPK